MSAFKLGEVRPPTDEDFMYLRTIALDDYGWKKVLNRRRLRVLTRSTEVCSFNMIKAIASFPDVSADVLYDTLNDPVYRISWDKAMKDAWPICRVSPNSSIEYYGMKSPFAFRDRDFVLYRAWKSFDGEFVIFNRSVFLRQVPPKPEYIRALSHLTGYLITSTGYNSCDFVYITQADPRGKIPSWAFNLSTRSWGPSILKSFYKAARNYPSWKMWNDPDVKPWRVTDRNPDKLPMLRQEDVLSEPDLSTRIIDETHVSEAAAKKQAELFLEDESE